MSSVERTYIGRNIIQLRWHSNKFHLISGNQLIDDRVDVGNGWQTKQLVKGTGFEADLPIKEPASDDSECHRKCFERSCIVLSFDSNRSPSETCRLGVEPLRISEHSSTSGEEIDILFVKFVFKFDG